MQSFEEQAVAFLQGKWTTYSAKGQSLEALVIAGSNWRMRILGTTETYSGTWSFYRIADEHAGHYGGMGYAISMTATSHDFGFAEDAYTVFADAVGLIGGPWGKAVSFGNRALWKWGARKTKQEIADGKANSAFVVHSWTDTVVTLADVDDLQSLLTWRRA